MTDFTASRLGQVNGSGDAQSLFLKVFPGEVLAAYNAANKTMDKHLVRTIASGKSATFPAIGKASSSYHTPGNQITGSAINHNERVITIDDILQANVFVADIDEAMNHFDVRGEYARQLGEELALQNDKHVLQMMVLAARASATITGGDGGTVLTNADYADTGSAIATGIYDAGTALDEHNVIVNNDVYCYLKPAQYNLLAQEKDVLNKDWNGEGSYARGVLGRVDDIQIVKTNNLPTTDIASGPTKYQGNFSTTVGVVTHKAAVGTVKLMDMKVEKERQTSRLGDFMVAYQAMGSGILRPECSVEMRTAAPV